MRLILELIQSGLGNLAAYLAAHVLLCLVPAFFIAGAMTALIPKEAVTKFLGRNRPKYISYSAAVLAGSLLAVCSCTIVPLFAGIYKKGAGIGPAITFLFFAPAANILALIYTGGVIGTDLAMARFILSLVFGISIGIIMALLFRKDDIAHDQAADAIFAVNAKINKYAILLIGMLVFLLLSGTLKIGLFTNTYASLKLPIPGVLGFQELLHSLVPFDSAKGEEGVSVQGALLILMLVLIGISAWKGAENILNGFNKWTYIYVVLIIFTILVAAVGVVPEESGVKINFNGKFFGALISLVGIIFLLKKKFSMDEVCSFMWESWRFVKQIFPLLIVGVFFVGIIRAMIRPEWIEAVAGKNSVLGNMAGVVFGVFMYFPTLVEVPVAKMFLSLGMHRGPLLAYLMADPELSLQSILITISIIGRRKTFTYVGLVAIFSTLAGLIYGMWIDGTNLAMIALGILGTVTALGFILWLTSKKIMVGNEK